MYREFKTIKEIYVDDGQKIHCLQAEVSLEKEMAIYGADADGRRGEAREEITDFKIEGIWDLESGDEVTDQFKDSLAFQKALDAKL
jgi:hypothetical protein